MRRGCRFLSLKTVKNTCGLLCQAVIKIYIHRCTLITCINPSFRKLMEKHSSCNIRVAFCGKGGWDSVRAPLCVCICVCVYFKG